MVEIKKLTNTDDLFIPKRLMKHILIWCNSGNVKIQVDEKLLFMRSHEVLTITSGQYHFFKEANEADCYILEFTTDYFCKNDNDIELIFHNGLFCHFDLNEVIPVVNHQSINSQLKIIENELVEKPFQYLTSIHSRIELILVEINREKVLRGDEIWKPNALFLRFLETVRRNFKHNYSLREIANLLNTTELKLNEQAKMHAGKTAQNVIYGLFISEAKRILQYENFSIKEAAYQLGFNDPFYFSKFFKKHTKLSPKSYQNNFHI